MKFSGKVKISKSAAAANENDLWVFPAQRPLSEPSLSAQTFSGTTAHTVRRAACSTSARYMNPFNCGIEMRSPVETVVKELVGEHSLVSAMCGAPWLR